MIENEDNLEPYQDVLAGLDRLADALDRQTFPLGEDQIARKCLLTKPSPSFWSGTRPALAAAAAVLVIIGLGIWHIWPGHDSHVKSISIATNMPGKTVATAPAGTQPSATLEAISFTLPSISLPSFSGDNSLGIPSAGQTAVQAPALPKSESIELKFEIPSFTFPTLTERDSDEM